MPFVQGHLRQEFLSFTVETECAYCRQPLHLELDSNLNFRVVESGAAPLVYAPMVDFKKLKAPSIIDSF